MAETTIEWADFTFNPWEGCTRVSEGCRWCYAETRAHRFGRKWGKQGVRKMMSDAYWKAPLKWNREAEAAGERRRVFCASLADVFEGEETMPHDALYDVQSARCRLWRLIEDTPHLDWLLLTKRPENVMTLGPVKWTKGAFPKNVWMGASAENQDECDKRYEHLINIPAAVRFLSCEPLLGAIDLDLTYECSACDGQGGGRNFSAMSLDDGAWDCERCYEGRVPYGYLHWVICGGESGPNARPMHPQWARSLRDQCEAAGVPFFFKQHGEYLFAEKIANSFEWQTSDNRRVNFFKSADNHEDPSKWEWFAKDERTNLLRMRKVGKKAAGRVLDGRTWDEFPEVKR